MSLRLGQGRTVWRLSGPTEVELEQVLSPFLCFFSVNRTAQVQAQLSRGPLSQACFEREQRKSDSLTAWEVMGGLGEKAALRTPDLHLSPLTPRV